MDILQLPNTNKPEAYKLWSDLRDMLCDLVSDIIWCFLYCLLCTLASDLSYLNLYLVAAILLDFCIFCTSTYL